ncbi:exonuclease 1 [Magnaporthiopsis poae ATCC 64411]|uniref:Exonuclease 1 n=1 Tax=Magnaporthiopsis poae (strain ATCC 64411 / 73-15) TaxID=644358 RepID=A0A0C4DV25_MAGP6|nr:exonuclease 1 [Magnaporthiopsis poae ATCC 64411]
MGISGLLPLLKSIHRPTELKNFAGETLAVDAYGWLHRGAVSCALELAQGKPTRKYVDFAMHRVRMVKYFGATPYLVFDGDFLPSKAMTESSRAKRREDSKKAGMELLKAGKPAQAYLEFQKAIDVTPEMARHLIEELKKAGLPYVVAPYEADAQMVYLERHGYVSGILSEDSDLLVFGAKRLLTKLDQHGQCVEINRRDFCACREISLTGWTDAEFRHMAIFSGCDYLDGLSGMGLKTAYRMIRKHKTPERIIKVLQFEGKRRISENYLASFKQAEITFLHQRVYCPKKKELVLLTEPTSGLDVEEMPFIGAKVDPQTARAIAVGDVNPITKERIILPAAAAPSGRRSLGAAAPAPAPARPLGKPIDQYFSKGNQRIPMGEMDANCFTVDPQRVAALTDHGLAPRVFPLPRPYLDGVGDAAASAVPRPYRTGPQLNRRRTEPISSLLGMEPPSGVNRRRTAGPPVRTSDDADLVAVSPSPRKKARLCGDDDASVGAAGGSPLRRSKFFTKRTTTPKKLKRRSAPGYLMSDDSIDDVLLSLPEFGSFDSSQSAQPRKSMPVFIDSPEKGTMSPDVVAATPIKPLDRDNIEVLASSPFRPLPGPSENETTVADTEDDQGGPSKIRAALDKFAYTPGVPTPSNGGSKMAFGLPTPSSSIVGADDRATKMTLGLPTPASSVVCDASSSAAAALKKRGPLASETPILTPLQRIGANAMGRRKVSAARAVSPDANLQTRQSKRSVSGRAGPRRSLPAAPPVNPSFVPLPKVDLDEVDALNRPQGSEDLIIPDSDAEDDEPFSPGLSSGRNLNLARFLYR